jgi:hypothetical protein
MYKVYIYTLQKLVLYHLLYFPSIMVVICTFLSLVSTYPQYDIHKMSTTIDPKKKLNK